MCDGGTTAWHCFQGKISRLFAEVGKKVQRKVFTLRCGLVSEGLSGGQLDHEIWGSARASSTGKHDRQDKEESQLLGTKFL